LPEGEQKSLFSGGLYSHPEVLRSVQDRKRVADFYTRVFGWKTEMLGPEMGNYVLATTTERDETGRPKNPGAINGGFFPKSDDKPAQCPSVVIAVEDIKEHIKKVEQAGGKVLRADGDTRCGAICLLYGYRGQSRKHAPAFSLMNVWS